MNNEIINNSKSSKYKDVNNQQIQIKENKVNGRTNEVFEINDNLQPIFDNTGRMATFSISVGNRNTVVSEFIKVEKNFISHVFLDDVAKRITPSISCFTEKGFLFGETAKSCVKKNIKTSQDHLLTSSKLIYKINETEKEILNRLFNKEYPKKELTLKQIKQYEDILYKAKEDIKKSLSSYNNLSKEDIENNTDKYLETLVNHINENIKAFNNNIEENNKKNKINKEIQSNEQLEKINIVVSYPDVIKDREKLKELVKDKQKTIKELKECRNNIFAYDNEGNKIQITPEEVLANYLANGILKIYDGQKDSNQCLGQEISFVVPDYMSTQEAEYLKYMLSITLDKNINIYRESDAIAAYYFNDKYKDMFVKNKGVVRSDETKYVVFSNIGESQTSLVYACFTPKGFEVIDTVSSVDLGGQQVDEMLYEYFLKKFETTHPNFNRNALTYKQKLRLFEAIEQTRRKLTVNKDANIVVESFYEDEDLQFTITKKDYEQLLNDNGFLDRYNELMNKLKNRNPQIINQAKKKESFAVEMAGDFMRTPIFQDKTLECFGIESLSKTILIDECCSVGGAILQNFHTKNKRYSFLKQISLLKNENEIIDKELSKSIFFPKIEKTQDFINMQKEKTEKYDKNTIDRNAFQTLFNKLKVDIFSLINNDIEQFKGDKIKLEKLEEEKTIFKARFEEIEKEFRIITNDKLTHDCYNNNLNIIKNKIKEYEQYLQQRKMGTNPTIPNNLENLKKEEIKANNKETIRNIDKNNNNYMTIDQLNNFLKKEGKDKYLEQESKVLNRIEALTKIPNNKINEESKKAIIDGINKRKKQIEKNRELLKDLQLETIIESNEEYENDEEEIINNEKENKHNIESEQNKEEKNKNIKTKKLNIKSCLYKIKEDILAGKICTMENEIKCIPNDNNKNEYLVKYKGFSIGLKFEIKENENKIVFTNIENNKKLEVDLIQDEDVEYKVNDDIIKSLLDSYGDELDIKIAKQATIIKDIIVKEMEKELNLTYGTLSALVDQDEIFIQNTNNSIKGADGKNSIYMNIDNDGNFIIYLDDKNKIVFKVNDIVEKKDIFFENNKIFKDERIRQDILDKNAELLKEYLNKDSNDKDYTSEIYSNNTDNNSENHKLENITLDDIIVQCKQFNQEDEVDYFINNIKSCLNKIKISEKDQFEKLYDFAKFCNEQKKFEFSKQEEIFKKFVNVFLTKYFEEVYGQDASFRNNDFKWDEIVKYHFASLLSIEKNILQNHLALNSAIFEILNKDKNNNKHVLQCKSFLKGIIQGTHNNDKFELNENIFDDCFSSNLEDLFTLYMNTNILNDLKTDMKENIRYMMGKFNEKLEEFKNKKGMLTTEENKILKAIQNVQPKIANYDKRLEEQKRIIQDTINMSNIIIQKIFFDDMYNQQGTIIKEENGDIYDSLVALMHEGDVTRESIKEKLEKFSNDNYLKQNSDSNIAHTVCVVGMKDKDNKFIVQPISTSEFNTEDTEYQIEIVAQYNNEEITIIQQQPEGNIFYKTKEGEYIWLNEEYLNDVNCPVENKEYYLKICEAQKKTILWPQNTDLIKVNKKEQDDNDKKYKFKEEIKRSNIEQTYNIVRDEDKKVTATYQLFKEGGNIKRELQDRDNEKREKVFNALRRSILEEFESKYDNRKYEIVCDGQVQKPFLLFFTKPDIFEFNIKEDGRIIRTIKVRVDDDTIYLNDKKNREYKINYKQQGDKIIFSTVDGTNIDESVGLFYMIDKYTSVGANKDNPINKTFESLLDKQLMSNEHKSKIKTEEIKKIETLCRKSIFKQHKDNKDLYYAHIDGNTLFINIKSKYIRYKKGLIKEPLKIDEANTLFNLDEAGLTIINSIKDDVVEKFERIYFKSNEHAYDKQTFSNDKINPADPYTSIRVDEFCACTKETIGKSEVYKMLGSDAVLVSNKISNLETSYEFKKGPKDIYNGTSIKNIKMYCYNKFLKSIEFSCDINGEKKKIIMEVNKNNEKEYYYVNDNGNKTKIDNDINTINDIEKQIKNFQLSFYDNLYAGYREKYQTNTLPAVQHPIDALFFALNTNYRFGKVSLPEEEKDKTLKQADNIINCIKDMKNNNKTTCYIPLETKTHATLLRIKQYVENGENKYSFTLYNSGGSIDKISPFFNKKNKMAQEVIEILSKKLKIDKKNINMEYKEKFRQRGPTCVMSSAFTAFIKDNVDNLRNKYKQLQLKQNRLNTLNNNIWKQQNNENYEKYKEEKNKIKDELFNLHELSNITLKHKGQEISFKRMVKNEVKVKDNTKEI